MPQDGLRDLATDFVLNLDRECACVGVKFVLRSECAGATTVTDMVFTRCRPQLL